MEKDLRKRLEEAADRHCKCDACLLEHKATGGCWKEICPAHSAYIAGGEYGYKEVINVATEWLETNIANQVEMMCAEGPLMMSKKAFLADFENNMNKQRGIEMKAKFRVTEPIFILPMVAWYRRSLCLAWLIFEIDLKFKEEKK